MRIKKIRNVKTPTRGTALSAGLDFYIPSFDYEVDHVTNTTVVPPHGSVMIPSGIIAEVPKGYALIAFNKSGVSSKLGLQVGACVVDEDYQGEIHINLHNLTDFDVTLRAGDKIVQFILIPVNYASVEVVDEIHTRETERGTGGFGSTGNG